MKNLIAFLLVSSLLTVTLSGCFGGESDVSDAQTSSSFQGLVEELTTTISGLDVSHVLVTEAKERVYLRSIMFDLSGYVEQKVRVTGPVFEEEVAGKPVNVVTVEAIDLLGDEPEQDLTVFNSVELGLNFTYDSNIFEVDQSTTRLMLSSRENGDAISIKLFKVTPEQDLDLYEEQNYPGVKFKGFSVNKVKGFSSEEDEDSSLVYFVTRDGYFYEITFIGFEDFERSELTELVTPLFESMNIIDISNDFFAVEIDEVIQGNEDTDTSNSNPSTVKVESTSKFQPIITRFESSVKQFLPAHKSSVSYSFTDNGYFYLVFLDKDSTRLRALFSYNDSSFTKIAEFKRGTNTDWELSSGTNIAYDRSQTLILISDSGNSREVTLEKGYRYFESRPLGFGLQYPQNWYYSRVDDNYLFSNKPIDEGAILIKAEVLKTPFASISASEAGNGVKMTTASGQITYYSELENGTIKISGSSEYAQQLKIMASSVQKVK